MKKKTKKKRKPRGQFQTEKVPVLGGVAHLVKTAINGEKWQFRMWLPNENKYLRVTTKTENLNDAMKFAQETWIRVSADAQKGKKVFSATIDQIVDEYLNERQKDVESERITKGRLGTVASHLKAFRRYAASNGYTRGSD